MRTHAFNAVLLFVTFGVVEASAQSSVDQERNFAWGENIGWTNWRHSTDPDDNVIVESSFLAGYVWAENIGWVNLGDGSPGSTNAGHACYSNADGTDHGVNRDLVTGELSGYAWSENAGWINFSGGALASPPNPARVDGLCRLRGYAWGENVGWINLDDLEHYVGLELQGDLNGDLEVNLSDLAIVLANFGQSGPEIGAEEGDLTGDHAVDLADLAIMLANFGVNCY